MKQLSFSLLALAVLILGGATFYEHAYGSAEVHEAIYSTRWFALLWGGIALSGITHLLKSKLHKSKLQKSKPQTDKLQTDKLQKRKQQKKKLQENKLQGCLSVILLHLSFLIILAGALLTSLTAHHGIIHLRTNEPVNYFRTEKNERIPLPFTIKLDTFRITYYPGTKAAADYISQFTVISKKGNTAGAVSMNRIFSYEGTRLYQSSYDSDGQGSLLTINQDPWGIPVTYTGYGLLFLSMFLCLCSPKGIFRHTLRKLAACKYIGITALLFIAVPGSAKTQTLSLQTASKIGYLQVYYNGRIAPVQTLSYDFCRKLTGQTHYRTYTPEQFLAGWLLYPSSWTEEPCIYIKDKVLRQVMGLTEWSALSDLFTSQGEYLLSNILANANHPQRKAAISIDEKVQLLSMLRSGELFRIFPVTTEQATIWYSSSSELPSTLPNSQWLFIRKGLNLLHEAGLKNDEKQCNYLLDKFRSYQYKEGEESCLTEKKIKAEHFYNRIPWTTLLSRINLITGLLCLLTLTYKHLYRKRSVLLLFQQILYLSFTLLTVNLMLRGYICGRLPMGNGYETMMILAWFLLLSAILVHRKIVLFLPFGLLLSGFCLLVASLGQMNPQITPLVPILSSPLLSLHVSLIMMSYALLSLTFLNSVAGIVARRKPQWKEPSARFQTFSQLLLAPALFLLVGGIFTGAIWANVSWGRYWGWDPKEVWALITLLVYSFALHTKSIPLFRHPLFFHIYLCVAFLSVLMTYFGVNYFLGGMHSYGT